MGFDWDEAKRRANLAKHGIDFVRAKEIWRAGVIEMRSNQTHQSEERYIALGMISDEVIAVVYTWRGETRRLISARKARKHETALYQDAFGRGS